MRKLITLAVLGASLAGPPTFAAEATGTFSPEPGWQVAQQGDPPMSEEELRQRKRELREEARELREQERQLREQERQRERRRPQQGRAWLGVGAGIGAADVEVVCSPSSLDNDCSESGTVSTYNANVTFSGPRTAIRFRGIRAQEKGNDSRTPYELAVLVGSRFGRSDWYGLVGTGRILHPDDEFKGGDARGFAWSIVFAPSSLGASGFELAFDGNFGHEVDFAVFSLGMRLGALE